MNFAASFSKTFFSLALLFGTVASQAQVLQVDVEEFKRLAGEVADLRESNQAQQRRLKELQNQVETLRSALRESTERSGARLGEFATREDLKKMADFIREVDEKRESDKKVILDQIKELGKTLATPPPETTTKPKNRRKSEETHDSKEPKEASHESAAPIEGEFYEYTVQKNDVFSKLVGDWNATLKEKGKKPVSYDDVKRANPKVNPNRIYEGQKILLPLSIDKK